MKLLQNAIYLPNYNVLILILALCSIKITFKSKKKKIVNLKLDF